jgi:Na+/H+ antiporter NhaD/arsenite permease-like protein
MISILILAVFIIGYVFIAFEHPFKIDKAASAILTGVLTWTLFAFSGHSENPNNELMHHVSDIATILFFIMGAMIIVETVKEHYGFAIITERIKTTNKVKLLWILSIITFFLSSVLDNLTTAIVMSSLLSELISEKKTRWTFAGMVIIAANAGGAWSPIGDVTTTMLWVKGQLPGVSSMLYHLFLPSLVCLVLPLLVLSFTMKGEAKRPEHGHEGTKHRHAVSTRERNIVFTLGMAGLLFVPVFKGLTGYAPFLGMMLSLGVLWFVTDRIHKNKSSEEKRYVTVFHIIQKIEMSAVFFFLGILLAVSALQSAGHLGILASFLDANFQGNDGLVAINTITGAISAIIDNVPLVAAAQGMHTDLTGNFAPDAPFWQLLAFCAGTGGSMLIIGSAAGVAIMGLQKIDFIWYLKNISFLALLGYVAGIGTYVLLFM